MINFDRYIAIDWSGSGSVRTPAIAVAEANMTQANLILHKPPHHSLWSRSDVYDFLTACINDKRRSFIGIDANLSYAHDKVIKHVPHARDVFDLWHFVENICQTSDNLYCKPYWSDPALSPDFWVNGPQPINFQARTRQTEQICGQCGYGHPESPFKLIGAKQVGKGGLSAMRLCHQLRQHDPRRVAFWPFSSPIELENAHVVIAEIYPRMFIKTSGFGSKKITDNYDLTTILRHWDASYVPSGPGNDHESDALISAAALRSMLSSQPDCFDTTDYDPLITRFEGWIFGLPYAVSATHRF